MAKKETYIEVALNKKKIASLVESYIFIVIYMKILLLQRYKKKLRFQNFY